MVVSNTSRMKHQRLPCRLLMEVFHRLFGLLLFFCSLPLYPLICLLIKLDDGGPVLYRGVRLGRHKIPFTIYKFRTLAERAELHLDGRLLPTSSGFDTRVGRFLRDSRLDEIPQLWNVVRGDMHLVGPRPVRPSVYKKQCESIDGFDSLYSVKPGLSGYAQLYTPYHTDKRNRYRLDKIYLSKKSTKLDARILVSTTVAMAHQFWRSLWHCAVGSLKDGLRAGARSKWNRRKQKRWPSSGVARVWYSHGDAHSRVRASLNARLLNMNDQAVAIHSREQVPEGAGEIRLEIQTPSPKGSKKSYKTARCRGKVIRREIWNAAGVRPGGLEHLTVILFFPQTRFDGYKIDKYFLKKVIARG